MTDVAPTSQISLDPAKQEELNALVFQRLRPRVYLERFLAHDYRPDGRRLDEWRDITINAGSITTADGSALVRLGGTTIVCGVKAEIAVPELDAPNDGFLVPNLDLPAICSPRFKPGPPSEEAQVLSDRLNDVLVASNVLPLFSLCIHPGKAAWVLYVDATCINYDGNAFDAALLAIIAALQNTRLPAATYDENTGRTTCSRRTKTPLALQRRPASYSFGAFDSSKILADTTSFEEPLLDTTLTVVLDERDALLSASQLGPGLGADTLAACIGAARLRHRAVHDKIYSL